MDFRFRKQDPVARAEETHACGALAHFEGPRVHCVQVEFAWRKETVSEFLATPGATLTSTLVTAGAGSRGDPAWTHADGSSAAHFSAVGPNYELGSSRGQPVVRTVSLYS